MTIPPVADLLPHAAPMILIDAVETVDTDGCTAVVSITPQSRFFVTGCGVPAYVGLEYMAQTCGAFAGLQAVGQGQAVRIGYLLGTRDFSCTQSWFAVGSRLHVSVREVLRDGVMGVFDCRIEGGGATLATARLNVYQPEDGGAR